MRSSDLIVEWYKVLWGDGNEEIIERLMHPQARLHGLSDEPMVGPEDFRKFYRAFREQFPVVNVVVKKAIHEGDYFATLGKATLTDTAGRTFVIRGSLFARVENGQFLEAWDNWDFLGLQKQIGEAVAHA